MNSLHSFFAGILVTVLLVSCEGCYTGYEACYATFSSVPAPQGENRAPYCQAAVTAKQCLMDDKKDCAGTEAVPDRYTSFVKSMEQIIQSCQMADCGIKQQKCSQTTLKAYNLLPKNGTTPDAEVVPEFCKEMVEGIKCLEEVQNECSFMAEQLKPTVNQFSSLRDMHCSSAVTLVISFAVLLVPCITSWFISL